MSFRALVIFVFAVLAAGIASVGCGGGVVELTPEATATRAPAPAATAEPTPETLPLGEYIILTLRMDADFNRLDLSFPSLQEDPEGFRQVAIELNRAISQISQDAVETLSGATPPPEAEAYHAALLDVFQGLPDIFDELAAGLESDDSDRTAAAFLDFTAVLSDFGMAAEEGQRLTIVALGAEGDDPLNAYLISAAEARLEVAAALADFGARLQAAATPGDAVDILEELIGTLERFSDRWQGLSPPSEAQELHQRQQELNAQTLAAERLLLTTLRDQDEAALIVALESLLEIGPAGARVQADWNELLIDALSR